MPNTETLYQVSGGVATITLNRPDKLNAWTAVMESEVRGHFADAEKDDAVRVIVLTGAGRGFCAGADISLLSGVAEKGLDERGREQALRNSSGGAKAGVRPDFGRKYSYFPSIDKPIIGAINGACVGLGLVISLYCDIRFAADTAKFSTAFSRRGLIAEYGLAWILPRLVGHANALDLLFSARMVEANEAHSMGLVNKVFTQETFMDRVNDYAKDIAANVSPRSTRIMKRQIYEAMFQTLEQAFETSEREMLLSLQSDDFKEGVAHFLQKRAPSFTGK
jgi:enoyl-CoA hydratase/carnithine racemase